jgi:probable HAF family extracellular repeat protein
VTGTLLAVSHAFLYSHGTVRDLGIGVPGAIESRGAAINILGHVTGEAAIPVPGPAGVSIVPMLWTGTAWRVLGKPATGDDYALPNSINDFDEIVGASFTNSGSMHAFYWKDGTFTVLSCLPGWECSAAAINDAGMIDGGPTSGVGVVWIGGKVFDLNALIDPNDPLHAQVRDQLPRRDCLGWYLHERSA